MRQPPGPAAAGENHSALLFCLRVPLVDILGLI
jgi:hypothetical protein